MRQHNKRPPCRRRVVPCPPKSGHVRSAARVHLCPTIYYTKPRKIKTLVKLPATFYPSTTLRIQDETERESLHYRGLYFIKLVLIDAWLIVSWISMVRSNLHAWDAVTYLFRLELVHTRRRNDLISAWEHARWIFEAWNDDGSVVWL